MTAPAMVRIEVLEFAVALNSGSAFAWGAYWFGDISGLKAIGAGVLYALVQAACRHFVMPVIRRHVERRHA